MFVAFSDRTRLRILHLLQAGELCVGDICGALRLPQSMVSRHLAYLRKAGLVAARKNGRWNFYGLAAPRGDFHKHLLECLQGCFREVPELGEDARRIRVLRKAGGCCVG